MLAVEFKDGIFEFGTFDEKYVTAGKYSRFPDKYKNNLLYEGFVECSPLELVERQYKDGVFVALIIRTASDWNALSLPPDKNCCHQLVYYPPDSDSVVFILEMRPNSQFEADYRKEGQTGTQTIKLCQLFSSYKLYAI